MLFDEINKNNRNVFFTKTIEIFFLRNLLINKCIHLYESIYIYSYNFKIIFITLKYFPQTFKKAYIFLDT